uniref:SH3 domain-binding glutamic acid-rich-like protein n=1 Tax=Ciona savignyi TaxID=51511 RepID=H2ZP97_CIOSA
MGIVVYTTSVFLDKSMRDHQDKVLQFLEVNNIEAEIIDLTMHTSARDVMLERMPEDKKNGKVLPPQVFNGDVYCGSYEDFFLASEEGLPFSFFRIPPPPNSYEEKLLIKKNGCP